MSFLQYQMDSAIGPIFLVASARGLSGIGWEKKDLPILSSLSANDPAVLLLRQAEKELTEYFSGLRKNFSVSLDVSGTVFQQKVWRELQTIPYGTTCAYKDIAAQLRSRAIRAVGTANGRNPLAVIIPCHRVINADGGLGGYAGGLSMKRKLLNLEKEILMQEDRS